MGGVSTMCRSLIVIVNTIVLVLSLALVGISIFLIVREFNGNPVFEFPETSLGDLSSIFIWIPFALSLIVMFVALAGCCVALEDKKGCIGIYGGLQFLFGFIIVILGVFFLMYGQAFTTISTTSPTAFQKGDTIRDQSLRFLNDLTSGIFTQCCDGPTATDCNLPLGAACTTGKEASCFCYFDQSIYAKGETVDHGFCTFLLNAKVACGKRDGSISTNIERFKYFQTTLAKSINTTIFPSGIGLAAFGALLVFVSFGSWYIACCARRKKLAY